MLIQTTSHLVDEESRPPTIMHSVVSTLAVARFCCAMAPYVSSAKISTETPTDLLAHAMVAKSLASTKHPSEPALIPVKGVFLLVLM